MIAARSSGLADVFRDCTIILMFTVGRSKASISNGLGCCTETVARIRRLYCEGSVKALRLIKPPRRPGRATPAFTAQMKQSVQTNPLTLGCDFFHLVGGAIGLRTAKNRQNLRHRRTNPIVKNQ